MPPVTAKLNTALRSTVYGYFKVMLSPTIWFDHLLVQVKQKNIKKKNFEKQKKIGLDKQHLQLISRIIIKVINVVLIDIIIKIIDLINYYINKNNNGYQNLLTVNDISLTCDKTIKSHLVVYEG